MDYLLYAITISLILYIAFSFYILYRNEKVSEEMHRRLDEKSARAQDALALGKPWEHVLDDWDVSATYDSMLYKFWVWPLSKFENKKKKK